MAYDLSQFKVNKKTEEEGKWENLGENARILIARAGNNRYMEAYRALPVGIRRMIEQGTIASEQADDLMCGILADTILLNWEALFDEGVEIPYSKEAAKAMMLKYADFRAFVWEMANEFQRFHESAKESEVKNSSSASVGS